MHLTRLALTDFRGYVAVDLRLSPGVSAFTGRNGQGKTNLLEAAVYVATFGSHRVASDAPLIRRGAQRAILRAAVALGGGAVAPGGGAVAPGGSAVASGGGAVALGGGAAEGGVPPGERRGVSRETLIEIEVNVGRANRVRLNRVPLPRPRDALGTLRCVLFAPEDLAMVKGEPDQRRRYLDDLLVATRPRFAGIRADYERVVRQRTALLKSARAHRAGAGGGSRESFPRGGTGGASAGSPPVEGSHAPSALEVWDEQLIAVGAELTAGRLDLVTALAPLVAKAYAAVSGEGDVITISYRQPGDAAGAPTRAEGLATRQTTPQAALALGAADRQALAEGLRQSLAWARRAELERGVCLVGPHRDELELTIGELPARGYASHGESWSLALALRIAAYDLLRSGGDDPVLLLDDVFAELDDERRDRLASLAAGAEQVLVTAAVPADVPARLAGRRYQVSAGEIRDA